MKVDDDGLFASRFFAAHPKRFDATTLVFGELQTRLTFAIHLLNYKFLVLEEIVVDDVPDSADQKRLGFFSTFTRRSTGQDYEVLK